MRRLLSISAILLAAPLMAQTPSMTMLPATAPGVPIKTFKTFSAHITGVNDKTVTWSVSGGASLKGNTVCTEAMTEDCTVAVYDATPGTYTITATSNSNHTTTTTGTVTFVATPTPVTTHPRLYLNSTNLAAFQAFMAGGSAIATNFINLANTLATSDDAAWLVSGGGGGYNGGNASAGCPGGGGGTGMPSAAYNTNNFGWAVSPEENAIVYALMAESGLASAPAFRCRAHDLYIYNMKDINNQIPGENPATCACLGNLHILLGNRGSVWSVGVGEVLDWVYSSFTASDFTNEILPALKTMSTNANINGGNIATSTPVPLGVQNNPSLFQTSSSNSYGYIRSFANNYGDYYSTFLIAIGIAIDAADDPSSGHCVGGALTTCSDGTPNSLRADFNYAMGAWMYMENANFEDPAVVVAEYNQVFGSTLSVSDQCNSNAFGNPSPLTATMPCYGNGRGGLSHEGTLYGAWLFHYAKIAAMLVTSGNNDPTTYPQISFFYSSWWDEYNAGLLHLTTPAVYAPSQSYQLLFNYGPVNAAYDQLNFIIDTQMAQYAMDQYMGRSDRNNELGWMVGNMNLEYSLATNMNGNLPGAVSMALTELPGATPFSGFTDPRPTMSSSYYSWNAGNLIASTGSWSATTGGVFRRYCPRFPMPNHEEGYCGFFDYYLNGDWVTGGIESYAFNDQTQRWVGEVPDTGNMAGYGNTPSLLPNPTNQNEYIVDGLANRGGQFNNGYPTGQTSNAFYSDMPNYTFDEIDSTGIRNAYGPNPGVGTLALPNVTCANTDYFWLKSGGSHFLGIYDRGCLGVASFMRRWMVTPTAPTISGTTVSWSSALNKTSDYLHILLQPNANIATYPVYPFASAIAANFYAYNSRIEIDANTINHVTTEAHSATNCSLGGVNAVCPTNRVNVIEDKGVTGGSGCGSLTQVSVSSTPASCQYNVSADYRYAFFAADLTAGVTLHYDWSTPASSFHTLNVAEAQNFGTGPTTTTLVQSTAGQSYDGFLVSTTAVMYMHDLATFTGVTYPASGATTQYVLNTVPNTTYTITGAGTPANATSDAAGVLTFASTGTGSIVVGSGSGPAAPTNLQGVVIQGVQVQ